MIRYELQCPKGHHFDTWFRDSNLADRQLRQGTVECPSCGSKKVKKALMAPRLSKSSTAFSEPDKTSIPKTPMPVGQPQQAEMSINADPKTILRGLRKYIEQNFENVGTQFAEEARKIHRGESERQGIYGHATTEEHRALNEEGIDIATLPWIPEHDA